MHLDIHVFCKKKLSNCLSSKSFLIFLILVLKVLMEQWQGRCAQQFGAMNLITKSEKYLFRSVTLNKFGNLQPCKHFYLPTPLSFCNETNVPKSRNSSCFKNVKQNIKAVFICTILDFSLITKREKDLWRSVIF